jgi:hypothetical protein
MGLDMSRFPSDARISFWAGIGPGNNEVRETKKRKSHPGEQMAQERHSRGCMGGIQNKERLLERRISPSGRKKGEETDGFHRRTRHLHHGVP